MLHEKIWSIALDGKPSLLRLFVTQFPLVLDSPHTTLGRTQQFDSICLGSQFSSSFLNGRETSVGVRRSRMAKSSVALLQKSGTDVVGRSSAVQSHSSPQTSLWCTRDVSLSCSTGKSFFHHVCSTSLVQTSMESLNRSVQMKG